MKGDLISRSKLLAKMFPYGMPDNGNYGINARAVRDAVVGAKAVEAELVVHAHWIDMQEDEATDGMWRCSACGSDRYFDILTPIEAGCYRCPNCGAHMDEEVADG